MNYTLSKYKVCLAVGIWSLVATLGIAEAAPRKPPSVRVPFTLTEIFGLRPVIPVRVNGVPFRMVIHSNAGFVSQVHHALAKKAHIVPDSHSGTFGISAPGKLSGLGRDEGIIRSFTIGKAAFSNVPTSIFETPGDQTAGMLGLDWIRAHNVVLDFASNTMTVNPVSKERALLRSSLLRHGYQSIPMTIDPDSKRYLVAVKINGIMRRMVVSTVSATIIDSDFAKAAGIIFGSSKGSYGGPSGATGQTFSTAEPVTLNLAGWQSAPIANATIEDTYAYSRKARPTEGALGGDLGADFAIVNQAIVDFGRKILYLRGTKLPRRFSDVVGKKGR